MAGEFEKLAYEAALRGLDKQENLLEALRTRTGVLLAASSLTASFLGQQAFQDLSPPALAIAAHSDDFFAVLAPCWEKGGEHRYYIEQGLWLGATVFNGLYEGLYSISDDLAEVYRRLAYELDHLWSSNDETIAKLTRMYKVAASAVVIETLALAALLGGSIF